MQQIKEGNPTARMIRAKNSFHKDSHFEKKLAIVWETGRQRSFLYRDYQGADYDPTNDPGTLMLYFYGWVVTLKGDNLAYLNALFDRDKPEIIAVTSSRYAVLDDQGKFTVTEATIGN